MRRQWYDSAAELDESLPGWLLLSNQSQAPPNVVTQALERLGAAHGVLARGGRELLDRTNYLIENGLWVCHSPVLSHLA